MDQDFDSVNQAIKFIKLFAPKFKIISFLHNLFMPIKVQFSFAIGNHIIDDLVLYYFADKYGLNMREIYEKEGEFIKMWKRIIEKKENNCEEIVRKLTEIFTLLICEDGYLCLSCYKSYLEKMLNLDKPYNFSKKVFIELIKKLCRTGFVRVNISSHNLNNKYMYFSIQETAILKKE